MIDMKTVKNADGSYTTTASLGEALMALYCDVSKWTEEEKKFFDQECKKILDRSLSRSAKPELKFNFPQKESE